MPCAIATPNVTKKMFEPLFKYVAEKLGCDYDLVATTDRAGVSIGLAAKQADVAWNLRVCPRSSGGRSEAIATVKYDGKPIYHAIMLAKPDLKSRNGPMVPRGCRRRSNMKPLVIACIAIVAFFSDATASKAQKAPAADQQGLVVVESANTMEETEKRLVAAIEGAGLKVAARIDHEANARRVGLELPPTVLILFGNPKAGTGLIKEQRTIGIDLPLKVLVWDEKGKIKIAYNDPAYIARRHGVDTALPVLTQISSTLQRFTEAAANR